MKQSFWICLLSLVLVSSMTYGQQPGTAPAKALKDYSVTELKQKRDAAAAANATADVAVYDQAIKLRTEIDAAVKVEDFDKANVLKEKLNALKLGVATPALSGREKELTDAINKAVAEENYEKAEALKKELDAFKNGTPIKKDTVVAPKPTTTVTPGIPAPVKKVAVPDTFQYKRFGWTVALTDGLYGIYNPAEQYGAYSLERYRTFCSVLELGVRQRTKRLSFGLALKAGMGFFTSNNSIYTSDLSSITNPPDGYSYMDMEVNSKVSSILGLKLELSNSLYSKTSAKFFYALGAGIERQTIKNSFTNGEVTFSDGKTAAIDDFEVKSTNNALALDLVLGPAFRLGKKRESAHLVAGVGGSFFITPVKTSDDMLLMESSGALKLYVGIRK